MLFGLKQSYAMLITPPPPLTLASYLIHKLNHFYKMSKYFWKWNVLKVTAVVALSFIVRCQFCMIYIVLRKIQNIFLFLVFLFFFEGTALFPWFLCVFSTWLDSPETFDCTSLYLCIHSCASQCFIVTCWWCLSPEMLYWNIQNPLKTCFIGGLLDHCKRKISGSSSFNLSLHFKSNNISIS